MENRDRKHTPPFTVDIEKEEVVEEVIKPAPEKPKKKKSLLVRIVERGWSGLSVEELLKRKK